MDGKADRKEGLKGRSTGLPRIYATAKWFLAVVRTGEQRGFDSPGEQIQPVGPGLPSSGSPGEEPETFAPCHVPCVTFRRSLDFPSMHKTNQ
jgi:hypothetical protein